MFTSRAELLDKGETTAEHSKNQREEAERLDNDKANTHPQSGGLFGGLFKAKAPSLKPVVDVDDGVVRCPSCAWELEDGEHCPGCGWQYRPDEDGTDYSGSDDFTDTDDDSLDDEIRDMEDDEFGDIEDDDSVWGHDVQAVPPGYFDNGASDAFAQIRSIVDGVYQSHGWLSHQSPIRGTFTDGSEYDEEHEGLYPHPPFRGTFTDSEYDEEEDDEYDDQDSFIDDEHRVNELEDAESDCDTVVGSTPIQHPPLPPRGPPGFAAPPYATTSEECEVDDDDDDDEEDDDSEDSEDEDVSVLSWDTDPPSQAEGTSSSPAYHDTRFSPSSSTEAEPDVTNTPQAAVFRGYTEPSLSSEMEESEPQSSSSPPRPMGSSRTTGSSARNAITIDDSEDEQPVGPVRRGTQRRRVRFSPY